MPQIYKLDWLTIAWKTSKITKYIILLVCHEKWEFAWIACKTSRTPKKESILVLHEFCM